MAPLSPELQRLARELDRELAAEDREIVKDVKREREVDEARRAAGLAPKKHKRDIRTYGFGQS